MMADDDSNSALKSEMRGIREDVTEIRSSLRDLAVSMNKLVLVEERQTQMAASLERAFAAIAKNDERLRLLEVAAPMAARAAGWIERAVFAILGIVLAILAKDAHFF